MNWSLVLKTDIKKCGHVSGTCESPSRTKKFKNLLSLKGKNSKKKKKSTLFPMVSIHTLRMLVYFYYRSFLMMAG